jgi:hypothetical protein
MSEIEVVVDVRRSADTGELIVSKQKVAFSGEARLIGAPVEARVGLVTRKARLSVFAFAEPGSASVIAAWVENVSPVAVEITRVAFGPQQEQAPPGQADAVSGRASGEGFPRSSGNGSKGWLERAEVREYHLRQISPRWAAMPPSRFWVAAYSGGEEVGRVVVASRGLFLDRSGITFHRLAMPRFDTLLEWERLEVLRAVAPLRGMDRDQWLAAGAQPLEGDDHTFVVWTSGDLGAIVIQTEEKGVELRDVVRESSLEQFATAEAPLSDPYLVDAVEP